MTRTRCSPGKGTAASRSPIPASTMCATSCCGAPSDRRSFVRSSSCGPVVESCSMWCAATPRSSAALRRDIELTKALGFNGVRKQQKVEDPRYLYWADHLGLVVWEEMPSAYRFTMESVKQVTTQWMEVIERDYSHPCIIVWVPFNEC